MKQKIARILGMVLITSPFSASLLAPFVYWMFKGINHNAWMDICGFMSTVSIVILLGIWLTSYGLKEK